MKKISTGQEQALGKIIDLSGDEKFVYVNDAAGNIRWLFPASSNNPFFLALYNPGNLKGNAYKVLCRILYKVNLKKVIVSGCFSGRLKSYYAEIVSRYGDEYAVFMGTPGEDRKITFAVGVNDDVTHFIKISVESLADALIINENNTVKSLEGLGLKKLVFPRANLCGGGVIVVTNIEPLKTINSERLMRQHFDALSEIYEKTARLELIEETEYFQCIEKNIESISESTKQPLDLKLVSKLREIFLKLKTKFHSQKLVVSRNHGDFAPWNMYVDRSKVYVYDWELSKGDAPLLFDLFHFIFQSKVLIDKADYSQIKKILNQYMNRLEMKEMIKKYNVNVFDSFLLYVVYIASFYYGKYLKQEKLHPQARWLMAVWKDALAEILQFPKGIFDEVRNA